MTGPRVHTPGDWILHVDLDQFLAAVEVARRPELAGRPVVVGGSGDPTEARKVVACASYEARAVGVRAGMPLRVAARRCPDAAFLPSDPDAYDAASASVMEALRGFGRPVEVWGWDEAYVSSCTTDLETAVGLAHDIRRAVVDEAGLSCSIGVSDNKQRAKIATGFGKPAGLHVLTAATWSTTMGDRPVDALWGVGPKTTRKLTTMGIATVADLAATDAALLTDTFGPTTGLWLLLLAKGGGDNTARAEPWVPRSRSHVTTFPQDLTDDREMATAVTDLARRTLADIVGEDRVASKVAVTVRTRSFHTRTKMRTLPTPSTDPELIVRTALELLDDFALDRPVRLLGVRLDLVMPTAVGSDR